MEKQNTGSLLKPILDLYKVEPELFNQDVLPIILSQNQNQQNDVITWKQKEESDKMRHRYQKLIKNKSRKSVKKLIKEYEDNLKKNQELDLKIKEIDEKYQK